MLRFVIDGRVPFKVLVVDDEPLICELVKTLLNETGVEVRSASSGAEAIECAANWLPDLVLLDVVLPGLDGLTTLRLLRALPGCVEIPIFMLTARVRRTDHLESSRAGADGHIEKPFRGSELSELVARLRSVRAPD